MRLEYADMSPQHQKVHDELFAIIEKFQKDSDPYLKLGVSAFVRLEFMGLGHSAHIVQRGASPELVIASMVMEKGAASFLSDVVGKPVSVSAVPMPSSEMEGLSSFIRMERLDEDGLPRESEF